MRRATVVAAGAIIVLTALVLANLGARPRDAELAASSSAPPSSGPAASTPATTPASPASATSPAPSDQFGFLVRNNDARVRSESSDVVISSFTPRERSFTFYSRIVAPDGRSVAYWEPVDAGAVLQVRPVTGGTARAVLTARPEMSGNAFTWSSDSSGLVAALDNNCQEMCPNQPVNELWTVDLASGATERIASGNIWIPITWDRAAKRVVAGTTGPGGYLTGYHVIDLRAQPYRLSGISFDPPVIGRLKASDDARYVLLINLQDTSSSLVWWPIAEPEKRASVAFSGMAAEWRPGTDEIWWVDGLQPAGCRIEVCAATQLVSVTVTTGARAVIQGRFGSLLEGFRVDGSAAIISAHGSARTELSLYEIATGRTTAVSIGGYLGGSVRLR
jgi:hypothetical protein